MRERKSRVLVTGASGFVGQAVCRRLLQEGYTPRAGLRSAAKWPDLQKAVPGLTEFSVIGDLAAKPDLCNAFQNVQGLIHLAARVHVMDDCAQDPLEQFRRINVQGSEYLAVAAAKHGVRRMMYVSSIKVNGEATAEQAFTEADPAAPEDPYGTSKWEAEELLRAIAARTRMEVTIVRPPLVYGPGVRANFLSLLKLVKRGIPWALPDTKNRRSMVNVENIASFLVRCVEHPGAANQTFLLSDGQDISTRELICQLARFCGGTARFVPLPESFVRFAVKLIGKEAQLNRLLGSLRVDSSKARHALQWAPPITLEEGLRSTVNWYMNSQKKGA
jgi:nucleoside-diphosphate-sugar epimerase